MYQIAWLGSVQKVVPMSRLWNTCEGRYTTYEGHGGSLLVRWTNERPSTEKGFVALFRSTCGGFRMGKSAAIPKHPASI